MPHELSFACCASSRCLAARIICALRSRRLASRFSAESSQTAFLPASSGSALSDVADVRASSWYRVMRLSCFFAFDGPAVALEFVAPGWVGAVGSGVRG